MSTLKATNLQHASATSPNITLGSDGSVAVGGGNISPQTGFRNRIINGDMRIDQRNSGASVTPTANAYTLDRWFAIMNAASKYSIQQSTIAPAGFTNSIAITSTSAYSVLAGDFFGIGQFVEGFNVADLGYGTTGAQTVTVSFWVRSSLTGTFSLALGNSAFSRGYVATYTINSANTWEYKTVTIAGDTSGSWLTNNGIGIRLVFNLGSGSAQTTTPNTWGSWVGWGAPGAVSVVGTNGATFYITGVQLEKGTVATPFEFRSIGQELALCQRYLPAINGNSAGVPIIGNGQAGSTSSFYAYITFPVTTRVAPTGVFVNSASYITVNPFTGASGTATNVSFAGASNRVGRINVTVPSITAPPNPGDVYINNTAGNIYFTGCEL